MAVALVWAFFLALPVFGGVAVGGKYYSLDRDFELVSFDFEANEADAFSAFVGFDLSESMLYFSVYSESSGVTSPALQTDLSYDKDEYSVSWHWNETTEKQSYANVTVGLFYTSYDVLGFEGDFLGFDAGVGITRYFAGDKMYFTGALKGLLTYNDGSDLRTTPEVEPGDPDAFFGVDGRVALGVTVGKKAAWSIQFGYQVKRIDFEDRFPEDDSKSLFVAARLFVRGK